MCKEMIGKTFHLQSHKMTHLQFTVRRPLAINFISNVFCNEMYECSKIWMFFSSRRRQKWFYIRMCVYRWLNVALCTCVCGESHITHAQKGQISDGYVPFWASENRMVKWVFPFLVTLKAALVSWFIRVHGTSCFAGDWQYIFNQWLKPDPTWSILNYSTC